MTTTAEAVQNAIDNLNHCDPVTAAIVNDLLAAIRRMKSSRAVLLKSIADEVTNQRRRNNGVRLGAIDRLVQAARKEEP